MGNVEPTVRHGIVEVEYTKMGMLLLAFKTLKLS